VKGGIAGVGEELLVVWQRENPTDWLTFLQPVSWAQALWKPSMLGGPWGFLVWMMGLCVADGFWGKVLDFLCPTQGTMDQAGLTELLSRMSQTKNNRRGKWQLERGRPRQARCRQRLGWRPLEQVGKESEGQASSCQVCVRWGWGGWFYWTMAHHWHLFWVQKYQIAGGGKDPMGRLLIHSW
jgi:hypothetical protein